MEPRFLCRRLRQSSQLTPNPEDEGEEEEEGDGDDGGGGFYHFMPVTVQSPEK